MSKNMNKYILTLSFVFLGLIHVMAQVPSGLNFQGIARGADGMAITNEAIIVQISILDNSNGNIDFSETHDLTTDAAGLFSLIIGGGENTSGDYEGLEWSISRDVSVGIDISADGSYDVEFTTPFHSVPYANYSKYTENVDDADSDPMNEMQSLSINANEISLTNGGSIVLPPVDVNDADSDPENEIQALSINGNEISLSNGGSIVLPQIDIDDADSDPENELQELSIDGDQLSLSGGNTVQLTQSSVIVGVDAGDVPSTPIPGQLYFDEAGNKFYIYHEEGWTLIQLGETVTSIYDTNTDMDSDEDGVLDDDDNCPDVANAGQEDLDNDNIGDVCDPDIDGDGFNNEFDNCPEIANADQSNIDNDDFGDSCDLDIDGDGIINENDNCPESANSDQSNIDGDGFGDVCDLDIDGDGIINEDDDCPEDYNPNQTDVDLDGCEDEEEPGGLHPAFAEFDAASYTIYLDGDEVVIETDGLPNHESPYWSDTHPLNIDPVCTTDMFMAPGDIDNFNGSYTLTVPVDPQLASSSSSTGLGAIGLAISGSVIYNDEEGPGIPLDNAVGSLDCNGAHTGPQSYHYHLEPVAWSEDDENLIGIMSDGFFLYGRRDYDGSYPSDLDASGGHFGPTPHNADGEYHYHIQNELYLSEYYILFPGDYQGTPNGISN